jgi:hypothetical protein
LRDDWFEGDGIAERDGWFEGDEWLVRDRWFEVQRIGGMAYER